MAGGTLSPNDLQAGVTQLAAEVSRRRELPLKAPIITEVLEDEAFESRKEHWRLGHGFLNHPVTPSSDHGMSSTYDPEPHFNAFYDERTHHLIFLRRTLTAMNDLEVGERRIATVRGIMWALQDQYFGFAPLSNAKTVDAWDAANALYEGELMLAVRFDFLESPAGRWAGAGAFPKYIAKYFDRRTGNANPLTAATKEDFRKAEHSIWQQFTWWDGSNFVETLGRVGGADAVNFAYAHPPASTDQIFHPDRYLQRVKEGTWTLTDSAEVPDPHGALDNNVELRFLLDEKSALRIWTHELSSASYHDGTSGTAHGTDLHEFSDEASAKSFEAAMIKKFGAGDISHGGERFVIRRWGTRVAVFTLDSLTNLDPLEQRAQAAKYTP